MVRIAVTGGIACGKSLVGSVLTDRGVPVLDTDHVACELMQPGEEVYRRVVEAFGRDILNKGSIDRGKLGGLVFADARKRHLLNELVHPEVRRRWRAWLGGQDGKGAAAAVIIPLLYEIGEQAGWDAVVCVACARKTQMDRLRQRGLSEVEGCRRIDAQMPLAEKVVRADYVIVNQGGKWLAKAQVGRVLGSILEK